MSRRLTLQTTPRLLTFTINRPALRCLPPLISHPNSAVSRGHVRNKYDGSRRTKPLKKSKHYGRNERLEFSSFDLTPAAYSTLKKMGIRNSEAYNLLGTIRVRTTEARGVRFVYDCLCNRRESKHIFISPLFHS